MAHSIRVALLNRSYGEEIARLRLAQTLLERALESAKRNCLGPATINGADQLRSRIIKNRTEAEHDNNTIFFEAVPPESSLKPIAKANMVKVRTVTSEPNISHLLSPAPIPLAGYSRCPTMCPPPWRRRSSRACCPLPRP
jgi:hypothetical protein